MVISRAFSVLVVPAVCLALVAAGMDGSVLCIGLDGHVAVEPEGACCCSIEDTRTDCSARDCAAPDCADPGCSETTGEYDCDDCVDFIIPSLPGGRHIVPDDSQKHFDGDFRLALAAYCPSAEATPEASGFLIKADRLAIPPPPSRGTTVLLL